MRISHLSSNRRERNLAHLFQFMTPARKLTHNMKFKCFWMQKDMNFGNTIIICHFGPENRQNPTQKDTNFGNTIIIRHFGPENPQNPTQKDTNFEKMHSLTPAKKYQQIRKVFIFPEFRTIIQMHSLTPSNTNQLITLGTPSSTFFEFADRL